MKQFLLFILVGVFSITCSAQDLSKKSINELEQLKTQAVANANYTLAEKIKTEINQRKASEINLTEFEAKIDVDIQAALAIEDYTKADELQQKKLKINKLKQIDIEINTAVAKDDFETADKLQQQQKALKAELTGTKAPRQQTPVAEANQLPANAFMPAMGVTEQTNSNNTNNAAASFFGVSNPNGNNKSKTDAVNQDALNAVLQMINQTNAPQK